MIDDTLTADVFVVPEFAEGQERPLVEAFTSLGFSTRTRVVPERRAAEQLTWLVLAALPLQAFLSGIGGKIGEDGYRGLKNTVQAVLGRHAVPPPAPLVLQDSTSGLQIVLDHDLPEEGYRQLLDLDLSQFRLGPVRYDPVQCRWRSELDEARRH